MKGDLVLTAKKAVQNHLPHKSSSGLSFISRKTGGGGIEMV